MTYQFDMFNQGSASQVGERQTTLEEMIEESKRNTKVLVGCETSGIVRQAFLDQGYDTWSCDLLPSDTPSNRHIQGDVRDVMTQDNFDLVFIGHPPCTRLCNSGVRWLSKAPPNKTLEEMWRQLDEGAELFSDLWNADVPCLAIENPVMHKVKKRTCFWTRNLPNLTKTGTLDGSTARDEIHKAAPSKDRWKIRSKFYPALAAAMADQWGRAASITRQELTC